MPVNKTAQDFQDIVAPSSKDTRILHKNIKQQISEIKLGHGTFLDGARSLHLQYNSTTFNKMRFYIIQQETPSTSAQAPAPARRRAGRRRRLALDDDKKAARMEEGRGRQQAILDSVEDERKED